MKNYTDEQIDIFLNIIKLSYKNYEIIIDNIYNNLFSSKNFIKHLGKKSKQEIFLNIKILEKYFLEKEAYEKLEKLNELKEFLNTKPKIKISEKLIRSMIINLN